MKRRIALVVGALAVVVLAARPVAAVPGAPQAAPTSAAPGAVPADALGLAVAQVSTNGLAVTLDAGASEEHDLVISNHTPDLRLSVKLAATDASGNIGTGAASWLAFSDDVVQLEPHAAITVPMTVAVPHDTQPAQALAHVVATVESATSAVDGSPRAGTTRATFPVAITVRGTPTATIAIADVHRDDDRKAVAIVLRNYGNQSASVNGSVRVTGERSQTLHFSANLSPTRDTTLDVPWEVPDKNKPVDVSVDINYGRGNVASWSSTLGGPPLNLDPQASDSSSGDNTTVTTTVDTSNDTSTANSSAPSVSKPWYKQSWFPPAVVLAILLAGGWFFLEMKRAGRREREMPAYPPFVVAGGDGGAAAELAKQLVRLTEIIVELSTNRAPDASGAPARARSPAEARAGPDPPAQPVSGLASPVVTPGFESRPESATPEPEREPDPQAAVLARLFELDSERRRLRQWMDEEDASADLWASGLGAAAPIANADGTLADRNGEGLADGKSDGPGNAGA